MRIVDQAKAVLSENLNAGDWVIDATAGNGHDTLFLKQCVGEEGKVWAFDVQAQALEQTKLKLTEAGLEAGTEYIHAGHEHLLEKISEAAQEKIAAIMFNLGYLPGGDKALITQTETTLNALNQSLEVLAPGGILSIILYPGHPGGSEEAEAVIRWGESLAKGVTFEHKKPEEIRAKRSPELVLIYKPKNI